MGLRLLVLLFVLCRLSESQLNLPHYQPQSSGGYSNSNSNGGGYSSGGYSSGSGGYGGNNGYSSSYSPASTSSGYSAPRYNTYNFDNYKAPPRTSRINNAYGMEAQGSNVKLNVGFSSGNTGGGWQRPVAPKGREAWKGSKGDSDFKFFTAIGSGIDHVKNGVKKVVKGVKSTKAKIVAKGISGVGTAVNAVTKGVAGVITKVADW